MIDAVLSFHTNPYTCGVAKFNYRLARELGVPCLSVHDHAARHPLYSLKIVETMQNPRWAQPLPEPYDLLLHDSPQAGRNTREELWIARATRIYAVNPVIAREIVRMGRSDVETLWCPSLIETPAPRAARTILTFGMARKFLAAFGTTLADSVAGQWTPTLTPHFDRLKALLDADGQPYTILLSMGVHEGSPWDSALEESADAMIRLFGRDRVEVLGFLSDAALHWEMLSATACAAFYDPALRANNTTAWAVLERARPLITNLDAFSPVVPCYDIQHLTAWPRTLALPLLEPIWGWPALIQTLTEIPCVP